MGAGLEDKLAALELEAHVRLDGRVSNGRAGTLRPPAAMDDMLYGSSDSFSRGKEQFGGKSRVSGRNNCQF